MSSGFKRYKVTVTRRWYDRDKGKAASRELDEPAYVMAKNAESAANKVRLRYRDRCGGPSLVTYTCRAEEVGER